jgi:hypothetical protein
MIRSPLCNKNIYIYQKSKNKELQGHVLQNTPDASQCAPSGSTKSMLPSEIHPCAYGKSSIIGIYFFHHVKKPTSNEKTGGPVPNRAEKTSPSFHLWLG